MHLNKYINVGSTLILIVFWFFLSTQTSGELFELDAFRPIVGAPPVNLYFRRLLAIKQVYLLQSELLKTNKITGCLCNFLAL